MIWDARTGVPLDKLPGHPWIDAIAWSPDSSTLATAGDEASGTKVWSIREGIADEWLTLSSTETRQGVRSVAFSPDGTAVIAERRDLSAVKAWDLSETGNAEWANIPTVGQFGDVGFLADGRLVASGYRRRRPHP